MRNPYGGPPATVPLRDGVDGLVFWTRNARPFRPALDLVRVAAMPFVVQYTVTGYPRALERSVVEPAQAVADMRALAARHGPRVVVWRYDPIVTCDLTPPDFHRATFARLAAALAGSVDEVVVSFAQIYQKTARNLDAAARAGHFHWSDPDDDAKRALAAELATVAAGHGMTLSLCTQPHLLSPDGRAAACVDARRLEDVAAGWGTPRPITTKVKGNRPGCLCHESRDIGAYDSCPHGCAYCYAVGSVATAKRRFAAHDPQGEFLVTG